jgi:acyl carrier protein
MEIKTFIKNFAALYDTIDLSKITAKTKFRNLEGWSSLIALSIIAMVDEEYDVKIKGDDIRNSSTINDLYEIVKSRLKTDHE